MLFEFAVLLALAALLVLAVLLAVSFRFRFVCVFVFAACWNRTRIGHASGQNQGVLSASPNAPRPINPVCYTRGATKLLVHFDVLFHVAGKQQEHTSLF